jgi:hypothetical protein
MVRQPSLSPTATGLSIAIWPAMPRGGGSSPRTPLPHKQGSYDPLPVDAQRVYLDLSGLASESLDLLYIRPSIAKVVHELQS